MRIPRTASLHTRRCPRPPVSSPSPLLLAGYTFAATTPGRRGLTALHLSGLVADGGAIASLLSEKCPGEGSPGLRLQRLAGSACLRPGRLAACPLPHCMRARSPDTHPLHRPPPPCRPIPRTADALSGWEGAGAEDGTLPIEFARRTGLGGVVERFIAVKK